MLAIFRELSLSLRHGFVAPVRIGFLFIWFLLPLTHSLKLTWRMRFLCLFFRRRFHDQQQRHATFFPRICWRLLLALGISLLLKLLTAFHFSLVSLSFWLRRQCTPLFTFLWMTRSVFPPFWRLSTRFHCSFLIIHFLTLFLSPNRVCFCFGLGCVWDDKLTRLFGPLLCLDPLLFSAGGFLVWRLSVAGSLIGAAPPLDKNCALMHGGL